MKIGNHLCHTILFVDTRLLLDKSLEKLLASCQNVVNEIKNWVYVK